MGLDLEDVSGQTPLDEDEKDGLKLTSITTRADLDQFEQLNIEKAVEWSLKRKFPRNLILDEPFVRELHKRMYGEVWKWAGEFRRTDKNIGVDKLQIGIELRKLIDDAAYWIDNRTFQPDDIAVRFSHRIVSIHCFSNGSGRHSRLIADILASHALDRPVFTWGSVSLTDAGEARAHYLAAIREADQGNIDPLIEFARG